MSDLARQLIAENKKTRATFLDLGNCGLIETPAEIGELTWLESLSLSGNWREWTGEKFLIRKCRNTGGPNYSVSDISPLAGLNQLQSLSIGNTQVADLAPLAGLTALRMLHISQTKVTDLAPLADLNALRELHVDGTKVADLTPLAGLTALQKLDASDTQVAYLAPLMGLSALKILRVPNTQVADLTALAGLTALQSLDISGTQVTDLTPLAGLSALQTLHVSGTQVADLTALAGLTALKILNLSKTQVADLTALAGLTALKILNLSKTQVADLTALAGLTALKILNLSKTQVADLAPLRNLIEHGCPVLWKQSLLYRLFALGESRFLNLPSEFGIHVKKCPLINPPAEIVSQGNDAILNYFAEREGSEVDHLYEAKLLILGEGGAGKTSLLRRLYQPDWPLPTERETTRGIAIYRHTFPLKNGRDFRLNVWDFGGQEIYHATHQFFLTRRSLYLLVDDTRRDHKSVSDEGFKYWLELIDLFGGHSPVLIFQNEKDSRSKAIDLAGITGRFDNVKERYAGNLEQRNAADAVRDGIEYFASHLSHIGEELPARWIQVRDDIKAHAAQNAYITHQEYFDIYAQHMAFDRSKALYLSRYLHDLGVFLHFQDDPLLRRTVILQNEWATEAVFRILDDETIKSKLGRFNADDCERLWRDSVFADMHLELLALMKRFELCYELVDSQPTTWLAPQLLPPAKPETLDGWDRSEDLVLRYRYDFMPKGLISRLTVRLHRFVRDPELAWVTGVLFERENTQVLVELLTNGDEIELRARGPERKALLSVVAADLDALNAFFEGLHDKVDKRIPCNCTHCRTVADPEFFAQKRLLKRKEDNRLTVECPSSYEDVDVLELLDGIRVDQLPGWAKEDKAETPPKRTIKIFLASSAELRDDRDSFDLYFRQLNDQCQEENVYLQIVRWEHFLDAMSETRLQDEYNKAVRDCDIFVSLFFTKTGRFTEEEFNTAHDQFKETGSPKIYTFFKDADVPMGSIGKEVLSLLQFKEKLEKLGHFYTSYKNIEDLKLQFRGQLDRLLDEPELRR